MRLYLPIPLFCLLCLAGPALPAQQPYSLVELAAASPLDATSTSLPDEPLPQQATPGTSSTSQQTTTSPKTDADDSQTDKAQQQLKQQESQRVLGVLPMFNISYVPNAVSLTAKQKFSLALHSALDPVTFGAAFIVAGYREALDDDSGFGWGPEGYMRRVGASYLDAFNGTMIGNAILPSILHQDPRYFRLGHGTTRHRILYSIAATVICKHDKTGKWEPNYSNVLGNIAAGAISNLYYPPGNSGVGQTFSNAMLVTAEGAIGTFFDEFWPDISRHVLHRDPTHGLDAANAQQSATTPQRAP